jgi:hypothetical protein
MFVVEELPKVQGNGAYKIYKVQGNGAYKINPNNSKESKEMAHIT